MSSFAQIQLTIDIDKATKRGRTATTSRWEVERYRRKNRRQALRWLTLAAALLAVLVWLLISAPVTRPTEVDDPAGAPDAVESTTYIVAAADLYAPDPTPEPTDCWGMTAEERGIVERVVEQEARGESYLGQMAVAQCIRTTAEAEGLTPYEVVTEDKQYAGPALEASDSVKAAVQAVLYDGEDAVAAEIRYFYAPDRTTSTWHESQLDYVCDIGNHRFFAEKNS